MPFSGIKLSHIFSEGVFGLKRSYARFFEYFTSFSYYFWYGKIIRAALISGNPPTAV